MPQPLSPLRTSYWNQLAIASHNAKPLQTFALLMRAQLLLEELRNIGQTDAEAMENPALRLFIAELAEHAGLSFHYPRHLLDEISSDQQTQEQARTEAATNFSCSCSDSFFASSDALLASFLLQS